MYNFKEKISPELLESPVGDKLNEILEQYNEIFSEFILWLNHQSIDGNITYAAMDGTCDGYNLLVQYKEYDTNKTLHFSVLQEGNLVLLEVDVPREQVEDNEYASDEWVETYEFGRGLKNNEGIDSYYHQASFVAGTLIEEYDLAYDENGILMKNESQKLENGDFAYRFTK